MSALFRKGQAALGIAGLCLLAAACSTHSTGVHANAATDALRFAEPRLPGLSSAQRSNGPATAEATSSLLQQDPDALRETQQYQPTPRWRSLAGPMRAESNSFGISAFYETSEFDTTDNFKTTQETRGLRALLCHEHWALDAVLASPSITTEDEYSKDDSGAYFLAAGASTAWPLSDRLAIHPRASLGLGHTASQLPSPLAGTSLDTELEWFQGDIAAAISYLPLADADYSLSPSMGVGYRYIDGFHDFQNGSTQEFDAQLPYGFLGMHWSKCIGQSSRWALEGMAMVGQLQGFQVSFSFFF